MELKNSIVYHMKREIWNFKFVFLILMIALFCLMNSMGAILPALKGEFSGYMDVDSIYQIFADYDYSRPVMLVFIAMICSAGFCEDMQKNYLDAILLRTSLKAYTAGRVLVNAIGIFIAFLSATGIYVSILGIWYPVLDSSILGQDRYIITFYNLPDEVFLNYPYIQILLLSVCLAAAFVGLTTCAMMISILLPSKYLTLCMPGVIYACLNALTFKLSDSISEYLDYSQYYGSAEITGLGIWEGYFLKLGVHAAVTVLAGLGTYLLLKRRREGNVKNEPSIL